MNCEEARKFFVDYWRGSLGPASEADLQAHLEACPGCTREVGELSQLWASLGSLPEPVPSNQMRMRFYDSMREWRRDAERHTSWTQAAHWWRHPAFLFASAAALLVVGVLIGGVITRQTGEIAQLRGEVNNMRQMVTLSLLQQQSASERLRGVNWTYRAEQSDSEVLAALLTTINHDPNVNVRLAAVDALRNFADSPVARKGLVQALAKQASPLVQIAILDQIVELREGSATTAIRGFLSGAGVNSEVKQRAEWALKQL